jgi:excisionase family DNA binding protein
LWHTSPLWRGDLWGSTLVNLADSIDGRTNALTVSDVAGLLNISERQVYKLAAENRIPSFKIGGSVRFDPAAFAAWLRQKIAPASVRTAGSAREARRVS